MRILLLSIITSLVFAQTAQVQIVHNSPSPTVDVYVDGVVALAFPANIVPITGGQASNYLDLALSVENKIRERVGTGAGSAVVWRTAQFTLGNVAAL